MLDLVKITLGKKDIKSMYWLLFSTDKTFETFINVYNSWLGGSILDEKGELGNKKPVERISVNMFRCFEGDILEPDIAMILQDVSRGRVALKKGKDSSSKINGMEDVARSIKTGRKLKECITEYYMDRYSTMFPIGSKWEDVVTSLPALDEKSELDKLRRATGENFLTSLLKRNLTREDKICPQSLAHRLDEVHTVKYGASKRKRTKPFLTFFTENLTMTTTPTFTENLPHCPLAFVDFSWERTKVWVATEIYMLF